MAAPGRLAAQLKDIKPPIRIEDWSFYLYWGVIIVAIVAILIALYFLAKTLLGLRKKDRRKEYLEAMKSISWNDTKKSAYEATRLGRLMLGDEHNRLHELYAQMVHELEKFKYKKEVGKIDQKTKAQFALFVKACDESI